MGGLVNLWVEAYKKQQPGVKVQVVSRGSATAPAALIDGSADLGPMARPMKSFERESFVSKYGFEPTQVRTALAAVGVFVTKKNPMQNITFAQLDQLFSSNPQREPGLNSGANLLAGSTWGSLGVSGPFAQEEIFVLGQGKETWLGSYFRQRVMLQQEYTSRMMTTTDKASLIKAVAANPGTIGFAEIGDYDDKVLDKLGVRLMPVRRQQGERSYVPSQRNIVTGKYPLSRYLSIYVVNEPGESMDPALADLLSFILSKQGQEIVVAQGLLPLPASVLQDERRILKKN